MVVDGWWDGKWRMGDGVRAELAAPSQAQLRRLAVFVVLTLSS